MMLSPDKNIINPLITLIIAIMAFPTSGLLAQDDSKNDVTNQVWVDFNPSFKISKRWGINGKIGTKAIYPQSWYKTYASVEGSYSIPKFMFKKLYYDEQVSAGLKFYYVMNDSSQNVIEFDTYQGYKLKWPNRKRIIIQHKVELTERFQWGTQDLDYSFGLKLSYEGSLTWKFQGDVWKYGKGFYLACNFKFWWNLISTTVFNDVARVMPGIGYQINEKWKTAFYVGWNYTRNLSADKFSTNSIIYRFRVYYKIPNKNLIN